MLFTQVEFLIFFLVVLGLIRALRSHTGQKAVLLLASYYFYAYWDWRFLGLIVLSTAVDYVLGGLLSRTDRPGRRRAYVVASLTLNLGILGFFKYYNFFAASVSASLAPLGLHVGTLEILLPIGISFYTFQTLSYTIDVYRGRIDACRSPLDFAVFVAFFPQLVAGPIVRASELLPQLKTAPERSWHSAFAGSRQFIVGMFKKVVLADTLALFVDEVFANAGMYDGPTTWLAVTCYALQIYFDFSGYSDMAIGTARVMGYRFNRNFNFPYLARSMSGFWKRWHISLSTWLRDYLYISLGGNRRGRVRTYVNLMLTMLLGGLWHGAAWTFVFWGGLHGAALVVQRLGARWLPAGRGRARDVLSWAATLFVVLVGWVFFRAEDFPDALALLRQMFVPTDGIAWCFPLALVILGLTVLVHLCELSRWRSHLELAWARWYTPGVLATLTLLVLFLDRKGFQPFIYFQF